MGEGSGYKDVSGLFQRVGESRMILFCEKLGRIYIYIFIIFCILYFVDKLRL